MHPDRVLYIQVRHADDQLLLKYFQEQSKFAFKGTHGFDWLPGDPREDPFKALDIVSEGELVEIILGKPGQNTLISRRIFHLNFEKYLDEVRHMVGGDVPVYISQMREPADRFVAKYYATLKAANTTHAIFGNRTLKQKVTDMLSKQVNRKEIWQLWTEVDERVMDENGNKLVTQRLYDKFFEAAQNAAMQEHLADYIRQHETSKEWNEQTRHFCGYAAVCQELELSRGALELAKKNLELYALVSIAELGITAAEEMLHKIVPQWFAGHRDNLHSVDTDSSHNGYKNAHGVGKRNNQGLRPIERPDSEIVAALQTRNALDVELYIFARELYIERLALCNVSPDPNEQVNVTGYGGNA